MLAQQPFHSRLEERRNSLVDGRHLGLVVVSAHNRPPDFRKSQGRRQSHMSETQDSHTTIHGHKSAYARFHSRGSIYRCKLQSCIKPLSRSCCPALGNYAARKARQTSTKCKPCRVGGNMKVEVNKAMDEQAATSNRCAHLNPAGLIFQLDIQIPEDDTDEQYQCRENQDTTDQPGLCQSLDVIIVGVLRHQV